jgi:hypothetical protein
MKLPLAFASAFRGKWRSWLRPHALLVIAVILVTAVIEYAMGRTPISTSGTIRLWVGDIHSPELSQQIADWYSFSHVLHGFLFYALWHLLGRGKWRPDVCLVLTALAESGWEILENTPFIIERYRSATAAQGYVGDSILNSMSDILFCLAGHLLAKRLPVRWTIGLFVGIELMLLFTIRDNLTLNILMLIYPLEAIKRWQLGP